MSEQNWNRGVVKFNLNGKPVEFNIYNNMPDIPGFRLSDAVDNWLARTDDLSDQSLCDYINIKDAGFKAYTQAEWDKIFSEIEQIEMESKRNKNGC